MLHFLAIHWCIDFCCCCFQDLAKINNAAMNIYVVAIKFSFFLLIREHTPRCGVPWSYGNSVTKISKIEKVVFQNDCTVYILTSNK